VRRWGLWQADTTTAGFDATKRQDFRWLARTCRCSSGGSGAARRVRSRWEQDIYTDLQMQLSPCKVATRALRVACALCRKSGGRRVYRRSRVEPERLGTMHCGRRWRTQEPPRALLGQPARCRYGAALHAPAASTHALLLTRLFSALHSDRVRVARRARRQSTKLRPCLQRRRRKPRCAVAGWSCCSTGPAAALRMLARPALCGEVNRSNAVSPPADVWRERLSDGLNRLNGHAPATAKGGAPPAGHTPLSRAVTLRARQQGTSGV